jgi:transposase
MNSIRYVGLDVHRKSVSACIRDADDSIVMEGSFECTREGLRAFAGQHLRPEDRLALEATFHSWPIVDVLAPFVSQTVVSNPMATRAIAQSKVKTDRIDARVLSELLRIGYLPEVWTPDPETRELRTLCARRSTLVSDRVRIKNRIHGVLAKCLVPKPKGEVFNEAGRQWLASLDLPWWAAAQIQSELRALTLADAELEAHDAVLVKLGWNDPRVRLLATMPGVDVAVALAVLAAIGDAGRFPDGERLAAYLGLAPSTSQSGSRCYHGPITKRGNGRARWLLIQAAQHLGEHPGPLGVFFRRIAARKNRNVAVVATARKLAVVAWHMLAQNEPYRYALPRPTQNKLARFRVRATGAKRKTGPKKGSAPAARAAVRTRGFPGLPELYASEGLPPAGAMKPGEIAALGRMRVLDFVEGVQHASRVCRKRDAPERAPKASKQEVELQ